MSEPRDDVSIEELLQLTPQLQALAGHLAREWDQREDLMQDTWVRVLTRPPRERTNLSSWLRGALRMQRADSARHQTAARRKQQPIPESEPTPTPDELVQRAEAHEAVVRALRKIDEPYREVLLLHYFENLSVDEIARRLNTPRGTVATHLRRGRERLRAELVSKHGDDAHRICKIAAGPAIGAATGALTLSPSLLPLGMLAAGLIALAIVVWPDANDGALDRNAITSSASFEESHHNSANEFGIPIRDDEESRTHLSTENDSPFETVTITGRCIDAETQLPIQGARVSLSVSTLRNSQRVFAPDQSPQEPEPLTTEVDGSFLLEYQHSEFFEYELRVNSRGHALKKGRWYTSAIDSPINSNNKIELGEIRLLPGLLISGRVIDTLGNPVNGTVISVRDLPLGFTRIARGNDSTYGRSAEDGTFELRDAIPFGTWPISVGDRNGYGKTDPTPVSVTPNFNHEQWTIVVEQLPTIEGTLVDMKGKPIRSALVYAEDPNTNDYSNKTLSSWTNARGEFRIRKRYPEAGSVFLSIRSGITESWRSEHRFSWGDNNVAIQVNRSREFDVRLTNATTGEPIRKFGLRASPLTWSSQTRNVTIEDVAVDEAGRATFNKSPNGSFWFGASPHDRALWVRSPVQISEESPGGESIELVAETLPATILQLRDTHNAPLPHASIAIYDLEAAEHGRPGILFRGHSNIEGTVEIHLPTDIPLDIEITPRLGKRLRIPLSIEQDGVTLVQVDTGTPVRITLLQPILWRRASLQLRPVETGKQSARLEFDAAFRVATGEAPAGDYWLELVAGSPWGRRSGKLWSIARPITLPADGSFELDLDLSAVQPATIHGRIWVGSTVVTEGEILALVDGSESGIGFRSELVQVAPDGSFVIEEVPQGDIRFHFFELGAVVDRDDAPVGYSVGTYAIESGGNHAVSIELALESARFRLVDSHGQTAPTFDLAAFAKSGSAIGRIEPDLLGVYSLFGCGPGSYEVEIRGKRYGPFIVEAGQEWTEFAIELRDD